MPQPGRTREPGPGGVRRSWLREPLTWMGFAILAVLIGGTTLSTGTTAFFTFTSWVNANVFQSGTVSLVDAASHAAGWAMFADPRLGLAVARGSGPAVAQLGAVARQAGTPVSLHGTGGAWIVASEHASVDPFTAAVGASLDRKVCNTLNTCCIVRSRAADLVPAFLDVMATDYGAGVTLANFAGAPESERLAINQWVSDETQAKIKDLLPAGSIGADTVTVLVRNLPAGAFFEIHGNRIARVSNYYNLNDWIAQVGA